MPLPTTSSLLPLLFGREWDDVISKYKNLIGQFIQELPSGLDVASVNASDRAAFFIPQLFVELGYYLYTENFLDQETSPMAMSYGMSCLSIGIMDDLVDQKLETPLGRMNQGGLAATIGSLAYIRLNSDCIGTRRNLISRATHEMIIMASIAGVSECHTLAHEAFDRDICLQVTRLKTSSYTVPALLLGAALAGIRRDDEVLTEIGQHCGTAFQLIDDMLDLNEDSYITHGFKTYPLNEFKGSGHMGNVISLVEQELLAASIASDSLPYPSLAKRLFQNVQGQAAAFLHNNGLN